MEDNNITSDFYELYSKTRLLIIDDLKSSDISENEAAELSQLILYRFIFLNYCEKLSIISLNEISNWKNLNKQFKDASKLFTFTTLFDKNINVSVNNEIIFENLKNIHSFDINFVIFGEIFERNMKDFRTKRKQDGVFYTPDNITQYICKNTIISYLSISGDADNVDELISEYDNSEQLINKLNKIKILDPSCGSGAFLIKSLDILYEIHKALNSNFKIENILNSLYGVDLNRKSVEITKLSLFLKSASINKDFNPDVLNKNITCGNSLIDDENISKKAFKWNKKFDIVLGNPPYVNIYKISSNKKEMKYYQSEFKSAYKKFDLYVLFLEKGLELLKNNGKLAYIIPDSFTNHPYGLKIREIILNNSKINKIVDLTNLRIFKGVSNTLIILFLQKSRYTKKNIIKIETPSNPNNLSKTKTKTITQEVFTQLNESSIRLNLNDTNIAVINKITEKSIKLGEICYVTSGTRSIPQSKFHMKEKLDENSKKLIVGKNIESYYLNYSNLWLNYNPEKLYNPMFPELFENEKILIRDISPDGKILASYDNNNYYTSHTVSCCLLKYKIPFKFTQNEIDLSEKFDLKYILGFISSKLVEFYFKILISSSMHVYVNDIRQLPIIPLEIQSQRQFADTVNNILKLNEKLYVEVNNFHELLNAKKLSRKLKKYYELDEDEFIKEIHKGKIYNDQFLEKEFKKSITVIKPLINNINSLKNQLDEAIYQLYDLTPEEIEIIEDTVF